MHLLISIITSLALVHLCVGENPASSRAHCSEGVPQQNVDIEQLMGMWYGIEIIDHKSEALPGIVGEEGCPVLYFSMDTTPTYNPIYGDSRYPHGYGYGRGYNGPALNVYRNDNDDMHTSQYTTQNPVYSSGYQQYSQNSPSGQDEYPYNTQYPNNPYLNNMNVYNPRLLRYHEQMKRIRLLWTEKGVDTEYNMRYNVTRPGVWYSSGPQNGSALEAKFNSFAGTVQVQKAVGNHMVLSFCYRMPDQQLFTVLLARVQNFTQYEIHGVHSMLHKRGYSTNSIRRVCTNGSITIGKINYVYLIVILVSGLFIRSL